MVGSNSVVSLPSGVVAWSRSFTPAFTVETPVDTFTVSGGCRWNIDGSSRFITARESFALADRFARLVRNNPGVDVDRLWRGLVSDAVSGKSSRVRVVIGAGLLR